MSESDEPKNSPATSNVRIGNARIEIAPATRAKRTFRKFTRPVTRGKEKKMSESDEPKNSPATSNVRIGNARIEIAPATRANPPDPIEFMKALVEQYFAELVARRDDFIFQPFLETASVSREIKRLQTVPEQLAWSRVFEEHGCIHCHRKNLVHRSCGCCHDCYAKVKAWKKRAIRRNSGAAGPELDFKLAACDQEKLARLALTGTAEPHLLQSGSSDEPSQIAAEPKRHSAWCTICWHPQRHEIEQDFINNGNTFGAVRAIARKYRLKGSAGLYKHARALGLNAKRAEKQI